MIRKRLVGFIVIATLVSGAVILLYVNNFFATYGADTFNHVLTPIVTGVAIWVYYRTLREVQNSNRLTTSDQNFGSLQKRLDNLKDDMRGKEYRISVPRDMDQLLDWRPLPVNYYKFLDTYSRMHLGFTKEYNRISPIKLNEDGRMPGILDRVSGEVFGFCFQYSLYKSRIIGFIKEYRLMDLQPSHRAMLKEQMIDMLGDFLAITLISQLEGSWSGRDTNQEDISFRGYDVPLVMSDGRISTVFEETGLLKLSKYIFKELDPLGGDNGLK